jgi:hypothetical protein
MMYARASGPKAKREASSRGVASLVHPFKCKTTFWTATEIPKSLARSALISKTTSARGRATPQQKKLLKDNYAKRDDRCVARVKDLYKELQLEKLFRDYDERH